MDEAKRTTSRGWPRQACSAGCAASLGTSARNDSGAGRAGIGGALAGAVRAKSPSARGRCTLRSSSSAAILGGSGPRFTFTGFQRSPPPASGDAPAEACKRHKGACRARSTQSEGRLASISATCSSLKPHSASAPSTTSKHLGPSCTSSSSTPSAAAAAAMPSANRSEAAKSAARACAGCSPSAAEERDRAPFARSSLLTSVRARNETKASRGDARDGIRMEKHRPGAEARRQNSASSADLPMPSGPYSTASRRRCEPKSLIKPCSSADRPTKSSQASGSQATSPCRGLQTVGQEVCKADVGDGNPSASSAVLHPIVSAPPPKCCASGPLVEAAGPAMSATKLSLQSNSADLGADLSKARWLLRQIIGASSASVQGSSTTSSACDRGRSTAATLGSSNISFAASPRSAGRGPSCSAKRAASKAARTASARASTPPPELGSCGKRRPLQGHLASKTR
mmetsp:Transcript_11493/g.40926  ORF Transcript_11493/g.40926 Transcript_11493/m.40926 type:complete len:456 (-) Transcript_11493:603-1970(-)